ncbi:MAG: hypothetical protein K4571_03725 [Deltaproteobacteria bacterium]
MQKDKASGNQRVIDFSALARLSDYFLDRVMDVGFHKTVELAFNRNDLSPVLKNQVVCVLLFLLACWLCLPRRSFSLLPASRRAALRYGCSATCGKKNHTSVQQGSPKRRS